MRRSIFAAAIISAFTFCGLFSASPAAALPSAPASVATAVGETNLVQEAAYVCRRVRRCGPYGCGWQRECFHTGSGYRRGWNSCPPGYSVQDGVCKPYRGY